MMNRMRLPWIVRWLGVLFSIAIHASMMLWLFWHWQPVVRYRISGESSVIQAALVSSVSETKSDAHDQHPAKRSEGIQVQASTQTTEASSPPQAAKQIRLEGEQRHALVALVYQAIAKHQHYPSMARKLHHQGVVELHFMLLPNGFVRDLRVVKASGYPELDQAAVQAVRLALPIQGVSAFVHHPIGLHLPIRFQ